jgi:hypothetical protein
VFIVLPFFPFVIGVLLDLTHEQNHRAAVVWNADAVGIAIHCGNRKLSDGPLALAVEPASRSKTAE